MCGIFTTKKYKKIIKKYNQQRHRGNEGFGILNVDKNNKITLIRQTDEKQFLENLKELKQVEGKIAFVHHRYPTSTENWKSQTHPIKVESKDLLDYTYYVMHNGVIQNDDELKKDHDKMGFVYDTLIEKWESVKTNAGTFTYKSEYEWNDSNALAIELARFIEGDTKDLKQVKGSYAFIVVQAKGNKLNKVFVGRNSGNALKTDSIGSLGSEIGSSSIFAGILYELNIDTFELVEVKTFTDNYASDSHYGFRPYSSNYADDDDIKISNAKFDGTYAEKQEWYDYNGNAYSGNDSVYELHADYTEVLDEYPDTDKNTSLKFEILTLLDEFVINGDYKCINEVENLLNKMETAQKLLEIEA